MSCQPKFINPLGMSIWNPPKGDDKNTGNGPFLVLLSISTFTTRASTLQVHPANLGTPNVLDQNHYQQLLDEMRQLNKL